MASNPTMLSLERSLARRTVARSTLPNVSSDGGSAPRFGLLGVSCSLDFVVAYRISNTACLRKNRIATLKILDSGL